MNYENIDWNFEYSDKNIERSIVVLKSKEIELLLETDNEFVIYTVCKITSEEGFAAMEQTLIATAASELATNIIRYAKKGKVWINVILDENEESLGIEILAIDSGPGITDIELAMKERYSTLPNSLGFGLSSVKRIMDEFYIDSKRGKGTCILVRKWKDVCSEWVY